MIKKIFLKKLKIFEEISEKLHELACFIVVKK